MPEFSHSVTDTYLTDDQVTVLDVAAGGYRLLCEIARGGLGAVLRGRDLGRDPTPGMLVEQDLDRRDPIDRFVEEPQICSHLQQAASSPSTNSSRWPTAGDSPQEDEFVSHPYDQSQRTRTAESTMDFTKRAAAVRGPLQREVLSILNQYLPHAGVYTLDQ